MKMAQKVTSTSFLSSLLVLVAQVSPATAEWREYSGIHYSGFESQSFRECGFDEWWWLETIEDASETLSAFEAELYAAKASAPRNPLAELPADARYVKNSLRLYLEGEGFLSKEGEYGHMGRSKRQLIMRRIDVIREATEEDLVRCQ